jgi:hypothetical protein
VGDSGDAHLTSLPAGARLVSSSAPPRLPRGLVRVSSAETHVRAGNGRVTVAIAVVVASPLHLAPSPAAPPPPSRPFFFRADGVGFFFRANGEEKKLGKAGIWNCAGITEY